MPYKKSWCFNDNNHIFMPESILKNLELTAINTCGVGTHAQTMRRAELKELQNLGWITEKTVTSFVEASSPISIDTADFFLPFDKRLELAVSTVQTFIELFLTEFELEGKYRTELRTLNSDFSKPPSLSPMESDPSPNNDTEDLKRWIKELSEQEASIQHRITTTPNLTERRGLAKELIETQKELVLAEKDVFLAFIRSKLEKIELQNDIRRQRLTLAIHLNEAQKWLNELITKSIERSIKLNDSLGDLRLALFEAEDAKRRARRKRELEDAIAADKLA